MLLPAAVLVAGVAVGNVCVVKREPGAAVDRLQQHFDLRVGILARELGRAPRLHDATAWLEGEVLALDIATPSRKGRALHGLGPCRATSHLGVAAAVEPCVIDLSWGSGDDVGERV